MTEALLIVVAVMLGFTSVSAVRMLGFIKRATMSNYALREALETYTDEVLTLRARLERLEQRERERPAHSWPDSPLTP